MWLPYEHYHCYLLLTLSQWWLKVERAVDAVKMLESMWLEAKTTTAMARHRHRSTPQSLQIDSMEKMLTKQPPQLSEALV